MPTENTRYWHLRSAHCSCEDLKWAGNRNLWVSGAHMLHDCDCALFAAVEPREGVMGCIQSHQTSLAVNRVWK